MLIGEAILTLDGAPLPAENWESVAVARYGEQTLVALISDDNESVVQRSLLLRLRGAGENKTGRMLPPGRCFCSM